MNIFKKLYNALTGRSEIKTPDKEDETPKPENIVKASSPTPNATMLSKMIQPTQQAVKPETIAPPAAPKLAQRPGTFEKKIQDITICVKNGDISQENVDCIVVPEFNNCASYGGVGYSIQAAGMTAGLKAYDQIAQEKGLGYGGSIITESGKEGVKLAHVVTAGADKDNQGNAVCTAIFNTLVSADDQGIKSVAIPELGTGIIGSLTQEQSAKAVFHAVYMFTKAHSKPGIEKVSFVVYKGSTDPAKRVLED